MDAFTIKDLENLSGIKAHTIRIWEQRYSFLKPKRTTTNIRYYSNDDLKMVLNIALLNKYGFKISHIDKMKPEELQTRLVSLADAMAVKERIVNELLQYMIELDIEEFEKTLNSYITSKGMERCISQIVFPFLEKIGMLWQTGHINPAQEHLVANIIRQKLLIAVEGIPQSPKQSKTALLFLPEGEYHELGILYLYYLLRYRRIKVLYMGANVPVADVDFVVTQKKPDYIFSHLTSTASNFNFEKFLNTINQKSGGIPVIISGLLTHQYKKTPPRFVHFKKSMQEVTDYLGTIS
jgi:MerR family transcriptional regulator, light-induced transcriptional regulator